MPEGGPHETLRRSRLKTNTAPDYFRIIADATAFVAALLSIGVMIASIFGQH